MGYSLKNALAYAEISPNKKIINLHNFSPSPAICIAMTGPRNCTSQSFFDDLGILNENKIIQHNLEVEI